ncbi:MAG: helix-turn-helix domain-containing protein [Emergencia sp.]|nr:helix-turn-helix domain-containing protein [Emergencia sp.]
MLTIGEKIKKARKAAGLTQKELGERLGVQQATISAFEKNKTSIKVITAERIANAIGCDIYDIITVEDVINRSKQILESFNPDDWKDATNEVRSELLTPQLKEIIDSSFAELNIKGKKEAAKRVEELTHIDKYTEEE